MLKAWDWGCWGCLWDSGHPSSSSPAPRSWPRSSYCSGRSPRLRGVPPNPPCIVPRLMSCLPAFSAQPALCLRPHSQPTGSQFQPAMPRHPFLLASHCSASALILPQDSLSHTLGNLGDPPKIEVPCFLHNLVSSWLWGFF